MQCPRLIHLKEMDLLRLKQATAADHAATEDSVPLLSQTLTRMEYLECLRRLYQVVNAWDHWADVHVPAAVQALRQGRRRAGLLADDLLTLGASIPPWSDATSRQMAETVVPGESRAVFMGRMYVMEGSTLGGQYIAAHVEKQLCLRPGEGTAYFTGYGSQTSARWREFKTALEALPDDDMDTVVASARNMFALFGDTMRGTSGVAESFNQDARAHEASAGAAKITE